MQIAQVDDLSMENRLALVDNMENSMSPEMLTMMAGNLDMVADIFTAMDSLQTSAASETQGTPGQPDTQSLAEITPRKAYPPDFAVRSIMTRSSAQKPYAKQGERRLQATQKRSDKNHPLPSHGNMLKGHCDTTFCDVPGMLCYE